MQHWLKFLDKNMQRNGWPFKYPILHNQQINRIYDCNNALSQVFGACGMEVVQQQCSPRLSNDLQYKNIKAISKKSSYFKKMKTLNNWQRTVTAMFSLEQPGSGIPLSRSIQSAATISTTSVPPHILFVVPPHPPPTLPVCLFSEVHCNSSHIKVVHPQPLFLDCLRNESILTALAFPLAVNPWCDNCLDTSSGLATNTTIRAIPSLL
jgi:hypothetical protein